jgi:hypothetical protein
MVMKFSLVLLASFLQITAYAGTVAPSPHETISVSADSIPDATSGILVNASCYGTNNRGTINPLSPSSRVIIYLSNGSEQILLDFPSSMVAPGGVSTPQSCGVTRISNNTLKSSGGNFPLTQLIATASSGNLDWGQVASKIGSSGSGADIVTAFSTSNLETNNGRRSITCNKFPISFSSDLAIENINTAYAIQVFNTAVTAQSFYGFNGLMDQGAKITIKVNSTTATEYGSAAKFLSVTGAFPGQDGFCGGYHSPLMFFFKESYPVFSGNSTLLKGKELPTSWVEANHEGYFLVHLKKADEEVTVKKLFGDNDKDKNGFEVLKKLDSNKDGVLNKKDKEFKNLYLWKDANGNSVNDKGETVKLSDMKVESIDLNYNDGYHLDKGSAVFKGRSSFKFIGDDKKPHDGEIFDIFFSNKK